MWGYEEAKFDKKRFINEWNKIFPFYFQYDKVKNQIRHFEEVGFIIFYIDDYPTELVYDIERDKFFEDYFRGA